ncbi:hypothetical protein M422DRAFT_169216 [Sphaerobolus stellatus SS14]|uniref:Peptide hydrolase n=1 Tax=Sphaerobolus stellatus (strain SS14) TaxID=990650 RepID=A0A0C9VP39_SPHS4|nr:hypothetical protein M422DRAFT_169216 [Sphaerobolus stellatus SS14]
MQGEPSFGESLELFQNRVSSFAPGETVHQYQNIFRKPTDLKAQVIIKAGPSALLTVPESVLPVIDTLLPRFLVPVVLPASYSVVPVPDEAVKRVQGWLDSLNFNPDVAALVEHLSVDAMRSDIRYLTGEDESSGIISRSSFSEGARQAAEWIKGKFESSGATCELRDFLAGFAPNVICRYPSLVNTTGTIILSAHYDSRGSFGSLRAPGGDDDGSGVLSILGIAKTIKDKGIRFKSNVELVAFAGEEQGLLGSRAYSKELREADANVTLMIQSDMLGYHKAGEPPQLGLPATIGTTEVAQLLANVSHIYSPELSVGITLACCSDHQTFHQQGFPATQAFERAGYIADPMYHNSGDVSDRPGYDLEQIRSIAKATFGTLLHASGFEFDEVA